MVDVVYGIDQDQQSDSSEEADHDSTLDKQTEEKLIYIGGEPVPEIYEDRYGSIQRRHAQCLEGLLD